MVSETNSVHKYHLMTNYFTCFRSKAVNVLDSNPFGEENIVSGIGQNLNFYENCPRNINTTVYDNWDKDAFFAKNESSKSKINNEEAFDQFRRRNITSKDENHYQSKN